MCNFQEHGWPQLALIENTNTLEDLIQRKTLQKHTTLLLFKITESLPD